MLDRRSCSPCCGGRRSLPKNPPSSAASSKKATEQDSVKRADWKEAGESLPLLRYRAWIEPVLVAALLLLVKGSADWKSHHQLIGKLQKETGAESFLKVTDTEPLDKDLNRRRYTFMIEAAGVPQYAYFQGRVMGSDDKVRRKETARGARVLPESPRNGYGDVGSPGSNNGVGEFSLEERWLINPALLFVGAKIGEGAHGKVYQGKYLDQNVAVKILQVPETIEEQAKVEARFAREVAMLCRVEHKNLVKFVGACKEPVMVIVTELLGGKSLRKYLANLRPKRLDLRCAVSFALDIAQAMECLHCNGIIHRDLKPDNLLLTDDKKVVKLVDFGLAREETLTEMMTAETGTYRWMAPELYSTVTLRNGEKKHYNHKVDVYSFGIVLWELLVNRLPFEGMSNLQAAYAAAFKKVRPQIADNLPEDLVFIVQSCWAEDPNIRPNFGQVVRMLNTFLATLPSPRMPDSLLTPTLTPAVPMRVPVEAPPNFVRSNQNQQQGNDDRDSGIVEGGHSPFCVHHFKNFFVRTNQWSVGDFTLQ
ncbi:hypothetical protein R1flu_027408 [Riccia fluitans]|uniref:Protein kinase domain-containing protein n=1 Tax=Riccia fluitans TaxID=41844 RepID=A0ABD1XIU2_9MARC